MRLSNHIAHRFLTDKTLCAEIVSHTYPTYNGSESDKNYNKITTLTNLLRPNNQKAYYITETVLSKLDLLKIKRNNITNFFDWTVFKNIKEQKLTFIFPDNALLRLEFKQEHIMFAHLSVNKMYNKVSGKLAWILFYANRETGELSQNFADKDVQSLDEFIYALLCFMYLTDNDELELKAGAKYGTRKQGKIINELPCPITIVNSRWNTTTIRTESFGVCGHFAIRWTGSGRTNARMVFINPFEKKGYKRVAKSITE
jgi:hypothetical protein